MTCKLCPRPEFCSLKELMGQKLRAGPVVALQPLPPPDDFPILPSHTDTAQTGKMRSHD